MKVTREQMARESLERIELLQEHTRAVDAAAYCISARDRHAKIDHGNLRDKLIQAELDEWRKLFMWAITLDDDERARIKAAAHERFLSDRMHVADWFSGGTSPGVWLELDSANLARMVADVVKRDAYRYRKLLMSEKHWLGVFHCNPDGTPSDSISNDELSARLDAMDGPEALPEIQAP